MCVYCISLSVCLYVCLSKSLHVFVFLSVSHSLTAFGVVPANLVQDPGGGGGVLLYFHTYVGSGYLFGFKILNFNIFWGFQKNEYFWGYEDFVDIFMGSSQNWASLRVISIQFRVFF